jgi:hypothetical protein
VSSTRDVGDRVNIRYEARNADGTLTNTTMALVVTDPGGDTSNPTITNTATGIYDASFALSDAGLWRWVWTASVTIVDVSYDDVMAVDPGPSTYAKLPKLRHRVTGNSDGDRDDELLDALTAAARAWDRETGRRPGGFELARTATARIFPVERRVVVDRDGRHRLLVDEIGSVDDMVVEIGDGTTWTAVTDYRTHPLNALADREPITSLSRLGGWGTDLVRVLTRWGWPVTSSDVEMAVLIAAHRLYMRRHTPEGWRATQDQGAVRIARLDPDVDKALKDFALPGFA